jgi:dihydropteroate synthase
MLALSPSRPLSARDFTLPLGGRTLVMGIVNVTPDSFSDGGRFLAPEKATAQARLLAEQGADILDIGAESTRPYGGMKPVDAEEELARLKPVLPDVVKTGIPVSADTMKAKVAAWALEQGAVILNDVWGFQRDTDMARVAAEHGATVVLMHNRDKADGAIDILTDIREFFSRSLDLAAKAGVSRKRIVLDPGIGFGKTPEQSIQAIARLAELREFGLPLLMGLSRKRFMESVSPAPPDQRLGGSIAGNVMAALAGADIVRVHDVGETVQALRVMDAIRKAQ